jgi:hypothetical protein
MANPEVRAKVATKLRAMGWKPTIQGGNGKGPTIQEFLLASLLGWDLSVIVPTRSRHQGYPTHYKIDVGNKALKIAIEIDGHCHNAISRKAQDKKKQEFLESRGWQVLRFSNQEVSDNPQACVQQVLSLISK